VLTVWCVCVGDKYSIDDVLRLQSMVARNLKTKHTFICLSDTWQAGVTTLVPERILPGWWNKLTLFQVSKGPALYLDLDVVVTGPLDGLLSDKLSLPKNWALSGHGGYQSSVMSWSGNDYAWLANEFQPEKLTAPERGNFGFYEGLWGDQEYISDRLGDTIVPMSGVYSYRYHCQGAVPDDASVVAFHGLPKPGDVGVPWVKAARYIQTLDSATN
jgi:hypothetical protein